MNKALETRFSPGSLVKLRGREWIVLPSEAEELLLLRPLNGSEQETIGIYLPLKLEEPQSAAFMPPDPSCAGNFETAQLLWNAARLSLRSGAGPFRCLGRLSVRPRPYQFVPLLMALRLDPVRLLIADDVGIGKTIEAGLIARELLDRGEAQRVLVLCPPYLCDQWQRELQEKFHIEAVVVRSGTMARLLRETPSGKSVFEYYPHLIVSIDYAKTPRWKPSLLTYCPDLVIVDEAHACTQRSEQSAQQQRHALVSKIAQDPQKHLLLLTATPHSGIEESFRSLLGLLDSKFASWDLANLSEGRQRILARHFIQRRRADVASWITETPFPKRESSEVPYELSKEYQRFFLDVLAFAREIVRTGEKLQGYRRRIRHWTALALLRCVMSSPAAARTTLEKRATFLQGANPPAEEEEVALASYIHEDLDQEAVVDASPTPVIERGDQELALGDQELKRSEQRKLRAFARRAAKLRGEEDAKLATTAEQLEQLLKEGFHPIIYCRYIATADYVARELRERLSSRWPKLEITSITGTLPEDERQRRVAELSKHPLRVLVATDCLSEGINLQEAFNAVIHYDLPWNPNRLEQREGRVDRFGQRSPIVKTILIYGKNNPVDGAVLDVLLRKAVDIRRTLGISLPIPINSATVIEAVLFSLLLHQGDVPAKQLTLGPEYLVNIGGVFTHLQRWSEAVRWEQESRTRFAQHAIRPEEVKRELEEVDAALGDQEAVKNFVLSAWKRLGGTVQPRHRGGGYELDAEGLPRALRERLGREKWAISFTQPTAEGTEFVERNHLLTTALAEYLLDAAFVEKDPPAARSAVIRTDAVERYTILFLLRIRFLLREEKKSKQTLAEECIFCGFQGHPDRQPRWLDHAEALSLLEKAHPKANVSPQERRRRLEDILQRLSKPEILPRLNELAQERARKLARAHRQVRRITRKKQLSVEPHLPPDVLGIYILLPLPSL
ncbi:MAG: DEAD/DEAH box helicase [Anaerolineae bacterium]|nr:DEAD/DEAH box helicase [Anaerolineae bacterium]